MSPLLPMVEPSTGSTLAFVGIVVVLCGCLVAAVRYAWSDNPSQRVLKLTVVGLAVWLVVPAALAVTGQLALLANSPKLALYMGGVNAGVVALACTGFGKRLAQRLPLEALIGVQAFRLPLELVLHDWYEQGVLPVQMTYSGANFDIVSGVLAIVAVLTLPRLRPRVRYFAGLAITVLALGLLLAVMSIALRSSPWPLRTYLNEPPVLLAFYAPYTWILPVCVGGALFAHVLAMRWLWFNRALG